MLMGNHNHGIKRLSFSKKQISFNFIANGPADVKGQKGTTLGGQAPWGHCLPVLIQEENAALTDQDSL